jgi:aminopeptidase-like protein
MRTKYGQYDEYHTSLDDLVSVVTPEGLAGGFNALRRSIETLERNGYPTTTVFGEPQLGKRGLYPTLSKKNSASEIRLMMNLITWSDGKKSLLEIAELCDVAIWELYPFLEKLISHNLLELNDTSK